MGVNEEEWIEVMKQTDAHFEEKDRKIEVDLEMDYYSMFCSLFITLMTCLSLLINVVPLFIDVIMLM
jgi:hypothetical protein